MIDETFGEVEYCEDLGFIAHKDIEFGGSKSTIEITISCDEEEDGIEQFQRDLSVKARINPACVLDKQPHSSEGASALDKRGQIIRQFNILHCGRKHKLPRQEQISVSGDRFIRDLTVHGDDAGRGIVNHAECVSEPDIYACGLDLTGFRGFNDQRFAFQHL